MLSVFRLRQPVLHSFSGEEATSDRSVGSFRFVGAKRLSRQRSRKRNKQKNAKTTKDKRAHCGDLQTDQFSHKDHIETKSRLSSFFVIFAFVVPSGCGLTFFRITGVIAAVARLWMVTFLIVLLNLCCARANDRNQAVIDAFLATCATEKPDFDKIDQKAAAMKLAVIGEKNLPHANGQLAARGKSWVLPLATGSCELSISEAFGPRGHSVMCGVSAPDVDAADFLHDLIAKMKLAKPSLQKVGTGGAMQTTGWNRYFGAGTYLVLFDTTPVKKLGIMLEYVTGPFTPP